MKNILIIAVLLFTSVSFAQKERALELNKNTDLIDVVYYHDNGIVSQTGSYTVDGKLQGDWLSYDTNGKKIVSAQYDNGKKTGKWFFWNGDTLKEVDYTKNAIASINEWSNKSTLAARN
jgi:antitoxin component YwqK of YwqJK toxin-antitoxin module